MYSDYENCAVCGAAVRLLPHPGVSDEAPDGPAGPEDGVVGGGDPTVDVRECTNPECPSHGSGGPDA